MLEANQQWFRFTSIAEGFSVYAFTGKEAVSTPYEFSIELIHESANIDLTQLLGTKALLEISDASGETRLVHGLIATMEQLHTTHTYTHYKCLLVPRLWFLEKMRDHRIFQNMKAPDIIFNILQEQGFSGDSVSQKLAHSYPEREFCVQYGESTLHFLSRLCEEEGIYYYFDHSSSNHTLCFCDREGGPSIEGEADLQYHQGSGNVADTATISEVALHHEINTHATEFREWNFTIPKLSLTAQDSNLDHETAPQLNGAHLEEYKYPHLYEFIRPEGDRYVRLELLRHLVFREWMHMEAKIPRFVPSYVYSIYDHPRSSINRKWWVVSAKHMGKQPGVLEHIAPTERGLEYNCEVVSIPNVTRFIPKIQHPKQRIDALQTAVITGPANEDIFTDKYGRVKVKFHWDRLGKSDESSSCWLRVSQTWAGENYGSMHIPRTGQEVLVSFLEGNPDRPLVTGRVYNADQMPPWKLPSQSRLSGIQSREVKADRRNQLIMDDTEGEIQTQLSSDHGLSQLNLGYLTRINHIQGRGDFRGEGFELRTDDWGVVRAGKGLYLNTEARKNAINYHKDLDELSARLTQAIAYHKDMVRLSKEQFAQGAEDGDKTISELEEQKKEIALSGKSQSELSKPHLLISSPAGIVTTTTGNTHIYSEKNTALTTAEHVSISTGHSFLVSALDRISMFAHKLGIKIFAATKDIQIQAQEENIEITAEKDINMSSISSNINITAGTEIHLNVGGSYLSITESGIEFGTNGPFKVQAVSHVMTGSKTKAPKTPEMPTSKAIFEDKFVLLDRNTGEPLADWDCEVIDEFGGIEKITTDAKGNITKKSSAKNPVKIQIKPLGPTGEGK